MWIFGPAVPGPIEEITSTYLTKGVLATLRECDHLAHQVLINHSELVAAASGHWVRVAISPARVGHLCNRYS